MDVKRFLNHAAENGHAWDADALLALAADSGFSYTRDEMVTAADELWGDLSEDQMRGIVGGGKGGNGGNPHPNPPPGHVNGSGAWSPPPGDVSGNSCFFMRGR